MLYRLATAVALLFAAPFVLAQTLKYSTGDPLRLGVGYNTLTGQYAGNCTVPVKDSDIKPAGVGDEADPGQLTKWQLSSEDSLSELTQSLNFSASASANFASGSVSASVQYAQSRTFNKYHQFLYVNASVANTTQIWEHPALTVPNAKLRNRPLDFLTKCGDTFVKTLTTGGELTAVLDVTTTASEDTSSLVTSLSGSYATAEAQAKLGQQISQRLANHQIQVTVFRNGGLGQLPVYTADQLIDASLKFPDQVRANPVPLQGELASYDTIADPVNLTISQEKFIKPLFRSYKASMEIQGNYRYMQSHTSEFRTLENTAGVPKNILPLFEVGAVAKGDFDFGDVTWKDVGDANKKQQTYSDNLETLARDCLENPKTKCSSASSLELPPALDGIVRVFGQDVQWNTSTGPVDITLDSAYICKVDSISGTWDAYKGHPISCNELPHTVINGHIVAASFDSYYPDNVGVCTYHFLCTRR
jgi:hypothetical protein